jgi:hypothetical protein
MSKQENKDEIDLVEKDVNIPDYISFFLNTNKDNIDKIYDEKRLISPGLLVIVIHESKNKVDVGYQDLDYLNRHANNELLKLVKEKKIYQINDVDKERVYIIEM